MKVKLTFTGAELAVLYEAYGLSLDACFYTAPERMLYSVPRGKGGEATDFFWDWKPEADFLCAKLSQVAQWAVGSFRTSTTPLVSEFLAHRGEVPKHENQGGAYSDGTGQFDLFLEVPFEYSGFFDRDYDEQALIRLAILEDALRIIIRGVQTEGSWPIDDTLLRPSRFGTLPLETPQAEYFRKTWLDEPRPDSKWSGIANVSSHALWRGPETSSEEWAFILWQMSFRWFWMLANQIYLDVERNFGLRFTSAMMTSLERQRKEFWRNPAILFRDSRIASFAFAMDGEANATRNIGRPRSVSLWGFTQEAIELSERCEEGLLVRESRTSCLFCFRPRVEVDYDHIENRLLCDECRVANDSLVPRDEFC